MESRKQFEKETGREAVNKYGFYSYYYVEWLEKKYTLNNSDYEKSEDDLSVDELTGESGFNFNHHIND